MVSKEKNESISELTKWNTKVYLIGCTVGCATELPRQSSGDVTEAAWLRTVSRNCCPNPGELRHPGQGTSSSCWPTPGRPRRDGSGR